MWTFREYGRHRTVALAKAMEKFYDVVARLKRGEEPE